MPVLMSPFVTSRVDKEWAAAQGRTNRTTRDFYSFCALLEEAKRRQKPDPMKTARAIYAKRTGEPCPFGPSSPSPPQKPIVSMQHVSIDFETRSRCDIRACGSSVYAQHESTVLLCMAYRFDQEDVRLWTPEDGGCPNELAAHIQNGGLVWAFNANFERDIWQYVCVEKMGWQPVPLGQWRDTQAQALAMALPKSLDGAAAALGTIEQKDKVGKATMLKLSQPRKPTKHDSREWFEDGAMFEVLYRYCRQDVEVEGAVLAATLPLSADELEVWKASFAMNERGIYCDVDAVRALLRIMALAQADYHQRVVAATNGTLTGDDLGSWQKMVPWCAAQGVPLENWQKGTLDQALQGDLPPHVRTVLEARQALGRTATAKFDAMLAMAGRDQRLRNQFVWHGATTGRWAGQDVQPQNLFKGPYKPQQVEDIIHDAEHCDLATFRDWWGDPLAAAAACVRGCLRAAPGNVLVVVDYSGIEARVTDWFADQADAVATYVAYDRKEGPDAYKVMASKTFRISVDQVTKDQRQLGKAQVLGCGFGCGTKTFYEIATEPPYNCKLTMEEAAKAVELYRETHPKVVSMWYALENAALSAVRSGTVTIAGRVKFKMLGPNLQCRLPSGRIITYPCATVEKRMTPWGQNKDCVTFMAMVDHHWVRTHTYGGSLMENVVQAAARDLTARAMVICEQRHIPVVLCAHDELVAEVPDTPFHLTVDELGAIMAKDLPEWAAGLPVAFEGFVATRYRK